MMSSRLALMGRVPITGFVSGIVKSPAPNATQKLSCVVLRSQGLAQRAGIGRIKVKRQTLKERAMAPASETGLPISKAIAAGCAAAGIGALCFYGMGLSNEVGAVDRAALWPPVVKERIRDTYLYFGASLIPTAASAIYVARSPRLMSLVTRNSWMAIIGTIGAMIGSGALVRSMPYQRGVGLKQGAWLLHTAVVGAVIAPITILGGPIMARAACYTAGLVGGLSTLAVCAPSDKFLMMGGPLAAGLGVVFIASLGSMFFPATTALGSSLYNVSMYGGLAIFGGLMLYDTQKIIRRAETHPVYSERQYDPINNAIGIYLDTVNIFIRIAMLLGTGGNRKR